MGYFDEWENEVEVMEVDEDADKSKMILSRETLEGLRMNGSI